MTLGYDTAATQTPNTNGGADTAFDTWATSLGIGTINIATAWTTSTDHASGIVAGTGGDIVIDTGVNSSSPFGAATGTGPSNTVTIATPFTRNYSTIFSYTVHNINYALNDPTSWNTPDPVLLNNVLGSGTLAARSVDMYYEDASTNQQGGRIVSPDGWGTFAYDGTAGSINTHRSGFVLGFSNPITAFGFWAVDFETTQQDYGGGTNHTGLAALFDSSGNLVGSQLIALPNGNDGDNTEIFVGVNNPTPFSFAMFIVGARDGLATLSSANSSARTNQYAFGGFCFLSTQIPEPSVVAGVSLAVLWLAVVIFRRCQRPQAAG